MSEQKKNVVFRVSGLTKKKIAYGMTTLCKNRTDYLTYLVHKDFSELENRTDKVESKLNFSQRFWKDLRKLAIEYELTEEELVMLAINLFVQSGSLSEFLENHRMKKEAEVGGKLAMFF